MPETNDQQRRIIRETLQRDAERYIDERVDRYIEVQHQGVIPNHHFADASTECLYLYRDGHFLSVMMVSQAVAEGVFRFVAERNDVSFEEGQQKPAQSKILVEKEIISQECKTCFDRIWKSFRNDLHHMNPKVAQISVKRLAKQNIRDLSSIENEIFAWRGHDGKIVPVNPKYWDIQSDGAVPVFLRFP